MEFCKKCNKELRVDNKVGYCKPHRHLSDGYKTVKANYRKTEKYKAICVAYAKTNVYRQIQTRYWKANKSKKNALTAKRRSVKLQATPSWLTKDHFKLMEMYYQLAKYLTEVTKIEWEVDHIIPLQGKNVSGLHVPWNLRVITASENALKFNKLPKD